MASNDGRIGCTTGRAKIIDPNDFNGFSSSSNVPVQLEDLNISVVLTTYKKPRTNLTTTTDGSSFESSKEFRVNFIEGSNLGGKKVLTTKYTDLTTSFEKGVVNEETLGISSIDIEFNSAMHPMVAINFIDVRGSSIFQNEENITGGYNKYSVFFQLPYPLFELEIKGYYGLPVKYCLHMLKFNSKFNSQTGNFEITCNFIGYSYAMLSDTLLGYLKVINYTKIGSERYTAYNTTRKEPILDLTQLLIRILNINKDLKKVAENDPTSTEYNAANDALVALDALEAVLNGFYDKFGELNTDKDDNIYIVFKTIDLKKEKENEIKTFKEDVTNAIEGEGGYNTLSESDRIDINNYTCLESNTNANGIKYYKGITKKMLSDSTDKTLQTKLGSQINFSEKQQKLSEYLNRWYNNVGPDEKLDIIDLSLQFEEIKKKRVSTESAKLESQKALAEKFQGAVKDRLGFEPVVRNVIECFTAAIEVFIETIFVVSNKAEGNPERTQELSKKFKADDTQTSDIDSASISSSKFYPWPDYREKDGTTGAYVEKYLGASGVLESPEKVDELVFIEDLLKAFRKAKKEQDEAVALAETEGGTAWIASSPLDSIVFGDTNPYSRSENKAKEDFMRILLIRAMTFLGYSNDPDILKPEEIQAMGAIEAEAMLNGAKKVDSTSGVLRQSLSKVTVDNIKEVEGKINGTNRPIILQDGSDYKYNYIFNGNKHKLIPVNKGFNDEKWGDATNYIAIENGKSVYYKEWVDKRDNEDYLFLTNYNNDYVAKTAVGKQKYDDGGTYIKIFKGTEFPTEEGTVPLPEGVTSDNVLILEKLKQMVVNSEAGFNSFGGGYGAQNFNTMDWGDDTIKNLELRYVFYANYEEGGGAHPNGLSLTRSESAKTLGLKKDTTSSLSDLKKSGDIIIRSDSTYKNLNKDKDGGILRANLGKNRNLFSNYNNSVSYPYINLRYDDAPSGNSFRLFSLFGSDLYYMQNYRGNFERYNKALLFLHSLPFNRNLGKSNEDNDVTYDILEPYEIRHLFDSKAGFVHVPRLWCAYLGGLLWRYSIEKPIYDGSNIIGGGSDNFDPIAWNIGWDGTKWIPNTSDASTAFEIVGKDVHLPKSLEQIGSINGNADYKEMKKEYVIWNNLPIQAQNEFKKCFFDFVNGTDGYTSFDDIREQLEIFDGSGGQFKNYLAKMREKIDKSNKKISINNLLNTPNPNSSFSDRLKKDVIENNYSVMTPVLEENANFFVFLEIKDDSQAADILKKALTEEYVIANNSYTIWVGFNAVKGEIREPITVSKTNLDLYLNSVTETLKKKGDEFSPTKETENIDIELFGTANKDAIRLQLYRTCKNIYDKWLGGATDVNTVMYQCGGRGSIDEKLSKKYKNTATKFIDSFRFVSRSFKDIGDLLYINPLPINDFLVENPNMSAYDAISSILASNKFEFQALPNFINFNNDETLKAIFKPYSYYDKAIEQGICGPSFVCVYAGQTSKHLDYRGGNYPNDGFDLRCIKINDSVNPSPDIPKDFIGTLSDYEDAVGAFTVKYSQQNQNIFKDIVLDQSEFSETDESLQIQDDISQKGAENNRSFAGQNIYNVYAVRSYNAQIEMMGNAMIQPMMYFQLDNIPMFHGAYMIINVKHSIKPNSMSTNFKGVRIRYPETPLITAYDVYMDLIATLDTSGAGSGTFGGSGGAVKGSFPPVIATIIDNGVSNGLVKLGETVGQITNKKVDLSGTKFLNQAGDTGWMITEAADAFRKMCQELTTWIDQQKKPDGSPKFKPAKVGKKEIYGTCGSFYRPLAVQQSIAGQNNTAKAGTSYHGWGVAVDWTWINNDTGQLFSRCYRCPGGSTKKEFDFKKDPILEWLFNNSYRFGIINPYWAHDGDKRGTYDEVWHWEYHGKAARCLLEKDGLIFGQKIDTSKPYDSIVKNPKKPDGKEAEYTTCDYVNVDRKDGTTTDGGKTELGSDADFWSLAAICSLEAGISQARCDVAQSIYNRLATPGQPYGKSLKEIIVAANQYEPTFNSVSKWKAIKDEKTAIEAIKASKGWDESQAKKALKDTIKALKDTTLQAKSKEFIQTRTEFLAYSPTSSKAQQVVHRTEPKINTSNGGNNYFYWEYAGKKLIGQGVPSPPDLSKYS